QDQRHDQRCDRKLLVRIHQGLHDRDALGLPLHGVARDVGRDGPGSSCNRDEPTCEHPPPVRCNTPDYGRDNGDQKQGNREVHQLWVPDRNRIIYRTVHGAIRTRGFASRASRTYGPSGKHSLMRFFSTLIASTLGTLLAMALLCFFVFLFLVAIVASTDSVPSVRAGSVVVMNLSGPIPERVAQDPIAQAMGLEPAFDLWDAREGIRKAAADSRVEALWIRMRGGQVSWPIANELRQSLLEFRESGKPIFASSEDFPVTENAYFIASVADSVFAAPDAFVEFNGFYIASQFYVDLLETLEVDPQVVRSGDYKGAVEPFLRESLSPENREQLSAILATQERVFVDAIASARTLSADRVRQLMTDFGLGSAQEAVAAGLLDDVRHHDEVISAIKRSIGAKEDADLQTVGFRQYVSVPARQAGIASSGDSDIAVVYAEGAIMS